MKERKNIGLAEISGTYLFKCYKYNVVLYISLAAKMPRTIIRLHVFTQNLKFAAHFELNLLINK